MVQIDVGFGHQAHVLVRLNGDDRDRLLQGVFRPGGRSVMFYFPHIDEQGVGNYLGAVIESVHVEPDGRVSAWLWFWDEIATIYVTPGTEFLVWYGRTVGAGIVLPYSAGSR